MDKLQKQIKRKNRISAKVQKTNDRFVISVKRSNRYISGQLKDSKGKVILSYSQKDVKEKLKGTKVQIAEEIGEKFAKKISDKKISKVAFNRAGYKYHGRVKSFAKGLRKGGLDF